MLLACKTISYCNKNFTIYGREDDYYFKGYNIGNATDDFLLYTIKNFVKNNATILDIGANIGLTATLLRNAAPNGRVLAFEPDPNTFKYLTQTLSANDLAPCMPYQIALGAEAGSLPFMSDPNDSSGNRLAPNGKALGGANQEVEVKRLDDFVQETALSQIDFIKMDVEGFEIDVLKGGTQSILKFRPILHLEFNSFTLIAFGNRNPRELIDYLKKTFRYIYQFVDGKISSLDSDQSIFRFIHTNLIKHGCVDDLLCAFEPLET